MGKVVHSLVSLYPSFQQLVAEELAEMEGSFISIILFNSF